MYTVHSGRPQDKRKSLTQIRVRLFQGSWQKNAAADGYLQRLLERDTGIEPAYPAWEAGVLPMN